MTAQLSVFASGELPRPRERDAILSTFQTPSWACEAIVERYYPGLTTADQVLEPTCGEGHFLDAIPRDVPAIGVELDERRAAIARERTGREIIVADVLSLVALERQPSVILGNPPFQAAFVDELLDRAYQWLPNGGRCGLVLPAFVLSTSMRLIREHKRWSIAQDAIPRELFPHLRLPVMFARFEKREQRTLVGFSLFEDMAAVRQLAKRARFILENGRRPVWKAVVFDAIRECGGAASLDTLYSAIEGRRPTDNPHWRAKVRQVVHCYCRRIAPATYALPLEDRA